MSASLSQAPQAPAAPTALFTFALAPPPGETWDAPGQASACRLVLRGAFLAAAEIAGYPDCAAPDVRPGESWAGGAEAHLELDWDGDEAHRDAAHDLCEAVARRGGAL